MRPDRERGNQQYKAINRNSTGKQSACARIVVESERKEHGGAADRIHNRKESAYNQENALSNLDNQLLAGSSPGFTKSCGHVMIVIPQANYRPGQVMLIAERAQARRIK